MRPAVSRPLLPALAAVALCLAACTRGGGHDDLAAQVRAANVHLNAARVKMGARDGAGCLSELDTYDKLDSWSGAPSSDPVSPMATMRGMCLMLAGRCSDGRVLYRAALQTTSGATMGPETLDKSVDAVAAMYCQGSALAPRDELLRALMDLNTGAYMETRTPAQCKAAYDTAVRLLPQVPQRDENDTMVQQGPDIVRVAAPECLARAGDCASAWVVFRDEWSKKTTMDVAQLRATFPSVVRRCAGG